MTAGPVVLKLGGSLITEKDQPETLNRDALGRAATAVADADVPELLLVHGGGSFGHHHATRHGITTAKGSHNAAAIRDIHDSMRRLCDAVLEALGNRGVPALPVHPLSAASRDSRAVLFLPVDGLKTMLGEGFVPVLHGDIVTHAGRGATVVSGDELVVSLARGLSADRVGLCAAVPGVLDTDGEVIGQVDSFDAIADTLTGGGAGDVTGGMAGKVRTLLDLGAPAQVFGLDGLPDFLAGGEPGTRIG